MAHCCRGRPRSDVSGDRSGGNSRHRAGGLYFLELYAVFFFSSRRRHTRSVSAFLLNRSSDLIQLTKLGYDATPFNQILKQNAKREMRLRLGKVTVADVLAAQPVTTNLLKFMRASIKMIGVSNLQSFIASMTQKLTLSDIS